MRPAPSRTEAGAWIALAIVLASQPGCGIAQRAGRGAAEAAIGTLARKAADQGSLLSLAEELKRRAAGAAMSELDRPEHLATLQRTAAAMGSGVVSGAWGAATREQPGTLGATPVEAIVEQMTRAFSRQLAAELGPTGEGPLSASLSGMTERLSRAGSAGVAAGVRESLGGWPIVLAFGGGALATIVIAWAWGVYRRRRPTPAS